MPFQAGEQIELHECIARGMRESKAQAEKELSDLRQRIHCSTTKFSKAEALQILAQGIKLGRRMEGHKE